MEAYSTKKSCPSGIRSLWTTRAVSSKKERSAALYFTMSDIVHGAVRKRHTMVSCWFKKLQHLSCCSTAVHNVSSLEVSIHAFKNGCLLHQIILLFGYEEFMGQWENSVIWYIMLIQKATTSRSLQYCSTQCQFFWIFILIPKEIVKTYTNAWRIKPNNFLQ